MGWTSITLSKGGGARVLGCHLTRWGISKVGSASLPELDDVGEGHAWWWHCCLQSEQLGTMVSLSPEREDCGAGGAQLGPVQANMSAGHLKEVLGHGLGMRIRILGL